MYTLVVRSALADQPPPDDSDAVPVVYVVGIGEEPIEARVQAEVAAVLREEAEIRFADKREEAVVDDEDGQPVRDDGLLLVVGDLPEAALDEGEAEGPFEVEVELYRSAADGSTRVLTVAGASPDEWTVTSSSAVGA